MKNVLCAIDLGHQDLSKQVLSEGHAMAQARGAKLSVVTVVPDYGMSIVGSFFDKGTLKKALEKANEDLHSFVKSALPDGTKVQHVVALGNVYEEVLETAKKNKSELIVIAANKPDLQDKLLGPNAARIARHADCSILIVR